MHINGFRCDDRADTDHADRVRACVSVYFLLGHRKDKSGKIPQHPHVCAFRRYLGHMAERGRKVPDRRRMRCGICDGASAPHEIFQLYS